MDEESKAQEPSGPPAREETEPRYTEEEAKKLGEVYAIVLEALDERCASGISFGFFS